MADLNIIRARLEHEIKREKQGRAPTLSNPAPNKPTFSPTGPNVRELRQRLNLSRRDFAKALSVSAATVALWETQSGDIKPQARSLAALLALYQSVEKE